MSSLVAFYRESLENVAELWNTSAERLGLQVLGPLEPGSGNNIFQQKGVNLFVGLYRHFSDLVHVLVERGPHPERLFQGILELPIKPVEVLLANVDWEFAEGNMVSLAQGSQPAAEHLDAIESGWVVFGVRSLQAFHRDLLSPPGEWESAARERGFNLRRQGLYYLLDVHWSDGHSWPEGDDSISGLPGYENEDVDRHMKSPFGTMILLRLTGLEPNPLREHSRWLETLPRVAQVLSESLSEGDTLRRFYTSREFVILKSGLTYSRAPAELERLREVLEARLKPTRLSGWLSFASWPEEAPDRDEMVAGSGWEKLHNNELSLAL